MQHGAAVKLKNKGSQKRRKVGGGYLISVDCSILTQSTVRKKGSPEWLGSLDANRGMRILSFGGTNIYLPHIYIYTTLLSYHFIYIILLVATVSRESTRG